MPNKTMVAMSGGVDSSVAALLIKESGAFCGGAVMRLLPSEKSASDADDARRAAERIGIPFYIFELAGEFASGVINDFISAYRRGATPNPCVVCNRVMKFGLFFDRAAELGYDSMATGHYARIFFDSGARRWGLKKGADESKDQSYVLYSLTQEQLSRTLFPLGELNKTQVREAALESALINAKKRESQDICFVPDGDYVSFIERSTGVPACPGDFVTKSGKAVGRHRGIERYTIGQRRGLGLSLREPLYVCGKCAADNTVILGSNEDLYSGRFTASGINLIACDKITRPLRVRAKVRYRAKEEPATVEQISEDRLLIEFDSPQRAITPGQAAVLYDGDCVVGGGTID
ncbi:MAG: tRNA 2-thiouridine(34) synthase MnmA [Synergistes sp.]|nr:tRNA 2-thiouridine(34) synthase MnmA [Synergistes sp.]